MISTDGEGINLQALNNFDIRDWISISIFLNKPQENKRVYLNACVSVQDHKANTTDEANIQQQ